jgi:dimethylhistidine N-methyltransferase
MLDTVHYKTRQREAFRDDVVAGLSAAGKTLPSRWLYDDRGCELFERITALEEYYPTRTETAILRQHAAEMAELCGPGASLLEYGAGAGVKTEILLGALHSPRAYLPVDIAGDFLDLTAARIRRRFPRLEVQPLVADFTTDFDLPDELPAAGRVGFFPGSTIGNLDAAETAAFLRQMRRHAGRQGAAIIGVDLRKDLSILLPAYDDLEGITAEFNLNLLHRINRELDADFAPDQFRHQARWNEAESAVEMHLVSQCAQTAAVDGQVFHFAPGETIHTESSRKYDPAGFGAAAQRAGWRVEHIWTDPARRFAVFGLKAVPNRRFE